jgi:hypothetical protein
MPALARGTFCFDRRPHCETVKSPLPPVSQVACPLATTAIFFLSTEISPGTGKTTACALPHDLPHSGTVSMSPADHLSHPLHFLSSVVLSCAVPPPTQPHCCCWLSLLPHSRPIPPVVHESPLPNLSLETKRCAALRCAALRCQPLAPNSRKSFPDSTSLAAELSGRLQSEAQSRGEYLVSVSEIHESF